VYRQYEILGGCNEQRRLAHRELLSVSADLFADPVPTLSYGQRFEDLHLLRCFGAQANGFYIDIGAGHPVVDNVSFAFYLKGWSGITVEPNPDFDELSRGVRPRDWHRQLLVGAAPGKAAYYRVQEFHGLSTTVEANAQAALTELGRVSDTFTLPVTTLAALCREIAPASIDFLKVDVEGAEAEVLRGGDWQKFRPKIVLVEALTPFTLAPAWESWEPLLTDNGYRCVFFDGLNRYYAAEEAGDIQRRFDGAPADYAGVLQVGMLEPALTDPRHPDRTLATLLARAAMARLPLLDRTVVTELLTVGLPPADLDGPADASQVAAAWERLFGAPAAPGQIEKMELPAGASLREVYSRLAESDAFRTACGRISASYAW
jgi:FkbM family methyltransferase